ncbi:winged helix-turn-helix transcriptional regulator [Caballeronia insecticola]|uniref:Putative transcriptional regulator n=1 Tax=Caballeronia insecticola TaxID=758793 RepID=R4X1I4_9BURK|nr:helix-turn-helix domain-containing protein [Caballeronia insecticola]BAN28225.1 putative transcriptional regulator [Caballeronia insecticola]
MYRKRLDGIDSSAARALDEVGEWWTLLIVLQCERGKARFDELQSCLGIARNVLSSRLERMIEIGVLERFPLKERANTCGYRLTPKGMDLRPVLVALTNWGDKWLFQGENAAIEIVDARNGVAIRSTKDRGTAAGEFKCAEEPSGSKREPTGPGRMRGEPLHSFVSEEEGEGA